MLTDHAERQQKIIHIDMDCFYAAIEIRDNPALADKPVAVGGSADERGVLCTSNYIARQYGVHSAMPTATALRLCKDLVLLPVNFQKYKAVAERIHAIFRTYSHLVEPLSLDEAYLDVTHSLHCKGSATLIAQDIRHKIWEMEHLTASAGVAPNKFLAKIASGWKKPNGLFVIRPQDIESFIKILPVQELYGVGKVTAAKLHARGFKTCADLQTVSFAELKDQFGKLGQHLYEQCRGMDSRRVVSDRERKSLSVEQTFSNDIDNSEHCLTALKTLHNKLIMRIEESAANQPIKNQFVKIKFNDFRQISAELSSCAVDYKIFQAMFLELYTKNKIPIRLLGIGVRFSDKEKQTPSQQSFSF